MIDSAPTISPYRQEVYDLLAIADPSAAYRYQHCEEPGYGFYWHCSAYSEHPASYIPNRCMLRVCPSCAEYLARRLRDHYRALLNHVMERHNPKHWTLKFVTFTTPISADDPRVLDDPGAIVREALDNVRACYEALWVDDGAAFWGRPGRREDREQHCGMIANIEVGENGHKFHVHCIILGRFIDQQEISWMWEALTGNVVTWVEKVGVDRAVTEVLKYVTKFSNLSPQTLVNLHVALKGSRRIRSYGAFYLSHERKEACKECAALFDPEDRSEDTDCPECGSHMRYSRELDYEEWRDSQARDRQQRQMQTLARLSESLLQFTEANKSVGPGPPQSQISLFDDAGIILPDPVTGL